MAQLTLMPDPKPLDRELGKEFFHDAPRRAGVYLMRDALDKVVYVGKAKNLRQRLSHYRLANPDRMPRRHLRMVREVKRIEFQFCANEAAALKREAKLLLQLRPKFNRAGVWPGKSKFLAWRRREQQIEMAVGEIPQTGWLRFGPMGGGALYVQQSMVRLLWLAVNPERSIWQLPIGWIKADFKRAVIIDCGELAGEAAAGVESFLLGDSAQFLRWLEYRVVTRTNTFERTLIAVELEKLSLFSETRRDQKADRKQLALL
jgi:predicted GIY-YIG superfamily endonuclease